MTGKADFTQEEWDRFVPGHTYTKTCQGVND